STGAASRERIVPQRGSWSWSDEYSAARGGDGILRGRTWARIPWHAGGDAGAGEGAGGVRAAAVHVRGGASAPPTVADSGLIRVNGSLAVSVIRGSDESSCNGSTGVSTYPSDLRVRHWLQRLGGLSGAPSDGAGLHDGRSHCQRGSQSGRARSRLSVGVTRLQCESLSRQSRRPRWYLCRLRSGARILGLDEDCDRNRRMY